MHAKNRETMVGRFVQVDLLFLTLILTASKKLTILRKKNPIS